MSKGDGFRQIMQPLYTDKRYGNFSSKNKRAIKSQKTLNCVLLRGRRHSENARCRVVPTPRRRHRQSSKPDMIRGRHRGGRGEGWRGAAGRDFRAAGVPRAALRRWLRVLAPMSPPAACSQDRPPAHAADASQHQPRGAPPRGPPW